jgi:dephospho-CoA kinase
MLIALTGGIGSGKSTVAKRLVELGATEIDADVLAREVVAPGTEGLQAVLDEFGADLLVDGQLDRASLGKHAFASQESRKKLEAILHPRIQQLAKTKMSGIQGLIVYTIPLLVEVGDRLGFEKVVTVSCPESVRLDRLIRLRGMTIEDAKARIASQASDAQREAIADYVINSDCSLDELQTQVDSLYQELMSVKN